MKQSILLLLSVFLVSGFAAAQDSSPRISWKLSAQKTAEKEYQISFSTDNLDGWEIFAPDAEFDGIKAAQFSLSDSSIAIIQGLTLSEGSNSRQIKSQIFDGRNFTIINGGMRIQAKIKFASTVPANLIVKLSYSFGNDAKGEFYQEETELQTALEGGIQTETRILIPGMDPNAPKQDCGTEQSKESGSGPLKIFLLGFLGGLSGWDCY